MPPRIPLDPKLPKGFDVTPNEERSKAELDAWWDHPYGVTNPDGTISVYCLDGGAWDRPTWKGSAPDYDAACVLAAEKLTEWIGFRERPTLVLDEPPSVVRMPQRPDEQPTVLATFETIEQASAWIKANYGEA